MIDSTQGKKANVSRHDPASMWDGSPEGYSQISVARGGAIAVLSGQTGLYDRDIPIPAKLGEQASVIARNFSAALEELNATAADIVMLRVYVVGGGAERFEEVWNTMRASLLEGATPSCSMIGVASLYKSEIQVEIEAIIAVS